ncbi:MAG: hypothetical protein ENTB_01391 [Enterocloster aldenensis]
MASRRSANYWKKRFELLEQSQNQQGVQCYAELERKYRQAQRQIETQIQAWYGRFASNNGISIQDARKMLTNKELAELKWDINEYIRYGEQNALSGTWVKELENASARYHISRLEALKLQTQQQIEVLFGNQLDSIDGAMKSIYTSGYYHTAYEIQKGFGVGWDFATLDDKTISKIINKPWAADGQNFSSRIWNNKQKLVNELNTTLTQNIILGQDPQKAIDEIARKMNTSKVNAGRLVMTEEAFFSSAAQKDCFNELDVEQFEVVATLDSHTSEICQGMDGQHFPMSQWEVGITAPPFHVNCRSTTVPYFGDDFDNVGERAARGEDGKTYHVPGDMTYKDWQKSFVEGDKSGLQEVKKDAKLTPQEQVADAEQKLNTLQAEYKELEEINHKYYLTRDDFNTPEERQAWREWKSEFSEHDDIVRVQQRLIELDPELSDAKANLATARMRLLKEGGADFTPASTVKEANEYAKKALGINAEYKGVDIRAVNEWNQGLTNMKQVFPDLVDDNFKFVGESHERNAIAKQIEFQQKLKWITENNVYGWTDEQCREWANKKASSFVRKYLSVGKGEMASSWSPKPPFDVCRGICMNKGYFGNFDTALQSGVKQVERQWHPVGCSTVKATFDHEFGHQLDDWLGVGKQKNIQDLFNSRTASELTNDLSEYAWNNKNRNRYSEMIAEAWSEYCNNPTPRPIAVEVGETIERLYVEWARKNF